MFTGIIEALGTVADLQLRGGEWRLTVSSPVLDFSDVVLGDSIAVNGVCLTVTRLGHSQFEADVSNETMQLTTLHGLSKGAKLNLEKALTPTKRLGGHIVSGHVDGVGELIDRRPDGASVRMDFRAPNELAKYIAQKGSICIDGTSLTVNTVKGATFSVNIIPHTQAQTIIQDYRPGQKVNLEVDLIARYLERLMQGDRAADETAEGAAAKLTKGFLAENGFV
ncbi:MAG: riboflavin synthase [Gammaproteobacteria bacterium]|nr:riboflavin synthase [Gammaproteobacteria bacterium]MDP2142355.1 riboflavin synthase [Gammaproteobacteria bacterium]MDP2348596.1 riboflavin synthase [Gammaproteobacteria bacterium]